MCFVSVSYSTTSPIRVAAVTSVTRTITKSPILCSDLGNTIILFCDERSQNCSRDSICDLLSVSQTYYYQRKSIIHHVLEIPVRDEDTWHKPLERIVRKYIQELNR